MEARKEFAETEIAREKLSIVLSKDMPRAKPADNPR
jgi:hypothetical protein